MKNRKIETWHIVLFVVLTLFMLYMVYDKPEIVYKDSTEICREDSLKQVIKELELINNDLKESKMIDEDGWDKKEQRYEDILFDYNLGLNHLKNYYPEAYREFHRIIGYRERYSTELERENKERLKIGL
jgi:hypothetical protein